MVSTPVLFLRFPVILGGQKNVLSLNIRSVREQQRQKKWGASQIVLGAYIKQFEGKLQGRQENIRSRSTSNHVWNVS